jgi:hypothetical protein
LPLPRSRSHSRSRREVADAADDTAAIVDAKNKLSASVPAAVPATAEERYVNDEVTTNPKP